jgi:hypothetical protein
MKKIAFCFLIYDNIINEELWNLFFKNVDPAKYRIYIHYKDNKPLTYFEKYKLEHCVETNYADVTLIHAHNLLFKKAYEDGCDKIISLSQSCIPFKSFDYVYDFLTKDDYGHFNVAPQSQCFPRCNILLNYYEQRYIQKSYNWFILNRTLCERVIHCDKEKINREYSSIYSAEEHYFITTIFYHHLEDQMIITPNLANDATTFTNWHGMDYKYPSENGLKNYTSITEDEIVHLMNSKCLFGRKFSKECMSCLIYSPYIDFITSKNGNHVKTHDVIEKEMSDKPEVELDSVVRAVMDRFVERAVMGKKKYGTDLDRKDLSVLEWIQHAQEEHMDAILYLEKLKREWKP